MLASIFAIAAWRSAIAAQLDISDAGELPLLKALREDSYRQDLVMNFENVKLFSNGDLEALSRSLPRALATCDLNFRGCSGLTSVDELGRGLSGLTALTTCDLYFDNCSGLTSVDELKRLLPRAGIRF